MVVINSFQSLFGIDDFVALKISYVSEPVTNERFIVSSSFSDGINLPDVDLFLMFLLMGHSCFKLSFYSHL